MAGRSELEGRSITIRLASGCHGAQTAVLKCGEIWALIFLEALRHMY
jgi:hypothetical protein